MVFVPIRYSVNIALVFFLKKENIAKERGTRVKDRAKNGASKRAGRGWAIGLDPLPLPSPLFHFFGSRFISRAAKTENPVPRSFFAPKPNGNACYAG